MLSNLLCIYNHVQQVLMLLKGFYGIHRIAPAIAKLLLWILYFKPSEVWFMSECF